LAPAGARNGHHPEETPGKWEELGNRHLARVFGPGGRRKRAPPPGATPGTWEELGNRHLARELGLTIGR